MGSWKLASLDKSVLILQIFIENRTIVSAVAVQYSVSTESRVPRKPMAPQLASQ